MPVLASLFLVASAVAANGTTPALPTGEYVRSDGFMHERLVLAGPSKFTYEELGCVGGPTTYRGDAQVSVERVSIQGRHGVLERELTPVTWGERRYLVPPAQMKRFCSYVGGSSMDEPIPFFLRTEDQSKPVPSAKDRPSPCK
jgi:hypothetical protein